MKRRPDTPEKLLFWWSDSPGFFQGITDATDDALAGIRKGAIEVEEDVFSHQPTLTARANKENALKTGCFLSLF
jgi:hypothetical protein